MRPLRAWRRNYNARAGSCSTLSGKR